MKTFFTKFQFLAFSILTIIISILLWFIAKGQSGAIKMVLTQFGYFAPALVAIILTLINRQNDKPVKIKSYLPFIAVLLCIIIIALLFGDKYYQHKIAQLLYENPMISVIISLTFIYFIIQVFVNKGANSIDRLVNIPKTKVFWYVLAIVLYPVLKLAGVLISIKLFPEQIELPAINLVVLIPLFLFSILFYAAIGEEVGWRGFALKKLQMKYNPFKASLFIGIAWSVWHIGYFTLVENYTIQNIPAVVIWKFIASFIST